MTQTRPVELMR